MIAALAIAVGRRVLSMVGPPPYPPVATRHRDAGRTPPCLASPGANMPGAGERWVAPRSAIAFRFIPPGCYPRELGMIRMVGGRGKFPFYRRDTITRGFWMAETETSQNEWLVVMADNPSYHKDCLDCPVESISWLDAVRFANTLSLREGLAPCYTLNGTDVEFAGLESGFRLPTKSEWKYAFRGAEGRRFPWGDEEVTATRANYGGTHGATTPVRFYADDRTPFDVYGLAANVSEWVNDWSEMGLGPKEDQIDPMGPPSGEASSVGRNRLPAAADLRRNGGRRSNAPRLEPAECRRPPRPNLARTRIGILLARPTPQSKAPHVSASTGTWQACAAESGGGCPSARAAFETLPSQSASTRLMCSHSTRARVGRGRRGQGSRASRPVAARAKPARISSTSAGFVR